MKDLILISSSIGHFETLNGVLNTCPKSEGRCGKEKKEKIQKD